MTLDDLINAHCKTLSRGTPVLPASEVAQLRAIVPKWDLVDEGTRIRRRFRFEGFSAAIEFLTRLAPLANAEDHHPDFKLTMYRWLDVEFRTNSIGGLSINDFIMAAKVDALFGAPGD